MNTKNQRKQLMYYLVLSIIGEALILSAAFFSSPDINTKNINISISDKIIFGAFFILICVLGLFSAVKPKPKSIRISFAGKLEKSETQETQKTAVKRKGHHPECVHFKSHTIRIKNKIFCAGCLGLAIGAFIAVFFMVYYIIVPNEISPKGLVSFVLFGMILVGFNFTEILLPVRKSLLHAISNIFLVLGFFFVSAGVFQLTGSVIYGLFSIAVSVLWLDTRIQLSELRHSVVCEKCSEKCKAY